MIIAGFDSETTGIDANDGHRFVEVAVIRHDGMTGKELDRWVQRINPERPIDAKAQAVHGISLADVQGAPTWDQVAPEVLRLLNECDKVVAHNVNFDRTFLEVELKRLGMSVPSSDWYCTMENGRWATFDGKSPKLGELCMALSLNYDQEAAHAADYDVEVMMKAYFAGLKRGFFH